MEDIFQILIFVAFAAFGALIQVKKDKRQTSTTSPHEVLEDMFPELNQETEMPMAEPTVQQHMARKQKKSPKKKEQQTIERTLVTPQHHTPTVQVGNKKVRLTSKEEARRAFIHSEIFNRKY